MIYDELGVEVTDIEATYAAMCVTLGRHTGKHNTMNLAKRCIDRGIEGDFVEMGVHAGGHPALMAYIVAKYGQKGKRLVHLYDSFLGMPMAGPDDGVFERQVLGVNEDRLHGKPAGNLISARWQVEANMKSWNVDESLLVYHAGWIQEVLATETTTPAKIALLRIDVDLHDSTTPCYEYLYDRVTNGGYIITDDYGENEADTPARKAMFAFFDRRRLPRPKVTRIPETPGTAWWQL